MSKSPRGLRLWHQLLLIAGIIVLVPLIVLTLMMHRNTVDAYGQVSLRAGEMSMAQAAGEVDGLRQEAVRVADAVASDDRVLTIFRKAQSEYPAAGRIDDIRTLRNIISGYESDPSVQSVRLVFAAAQPWLSNNGFISLPMDVLRDAFEQNGIAWKTDELAMSPHWLAALPMTAATGLFATEDIAYVRIIRDLRDFECVFGYVVVTQERALYDRTLNQADLTEESAIVLCDARGERVAGGGSMTDIDAYWTLYREEGQAHAAGLWDSGTQVLKRDAPPDGWSLVMLLPQVAYQQNVSRITTLTIGLVAALLCLAMLLAGGMYRLILRRIDRIVQSMGRVQQGDLSARLPAVRRDELGSIEERFNYMVRRLQASVRENEALAERERRGRIQLLQVQINPHFLYNTLNSILWTARDYGAQKVCEMTKALSDFYKIGLQPGREEATVSDELLHVRRYVSLQNLRGKCRVALAVAVEEPLWNVMIPNMLLQPLVENSFVHGFVGQSEGHVDIRIARVGETVDGHMEMEGETGVRVEIRVADDGLGVPAGEMDRLAEQPADSYGLVSIRERLALKYGAKAGIRFGEGLNGRGLAVTLWIDAEDGARETAEDS